MKKLPAIIVVVILSFAPVAQALKSPTITSGNISVGKFYTVSVPAEASYPDRWPNEWTTGAKLTDEDLGRSWPLSEWVGWLIHEPYTLEIVLDLGKVCEVDNIRIRLNSRLEYGIKFPESVIFYTRENTDQPWQKYGQTQNPSPDTEYYNAIWVEEQAGFVNARYIKYEVVGPVSAYLFIGEIEAHGNIINSWKNVPDWGCYHGAYPSNTSYNMSISTYENVTGKKMSMVLWYALMGSSNFKDYLGSLWRSQYGLSYNIDYVGARYLEVGWEPGNYITAEQVASGHYDVYFKTFFQESIDYSNRLGNTDPVWLRPMSEMNGAWTFPGNAAAWGGDPLNFRRAWRRMYNVAEQVNAADAHIFLWSPNGYTYSGAEHMPNNYYPGDQYVDWVGLSVYVQGDVPYPNDILTGTAGPGSFDFYGTYSYKPMIVSEGAFRPKDGVDGIEWIDQWFNLPYNFPMVKALVWFYIHDADYNVLLEEPYVSFYKQRISEDYFLRQSIAGILDYNADYYINFPDYAAFSSNWTAQGSNYYGDINGDNSVDMDDLAIIMSNWLD